MKCGISGSQTRTKIASCLVAGVCVFVAALCDGTCADGDGTAAEPTGLQIVKYAHPGLVVDLGVGLWAWPLPMDYDGDGDMDLVVSCPDKPYNGTYFFENPGPGESGSVKTGSAKSSPGGSMPVFRPGVRISRGLRNVHVTFVEGQPRVLSPGQEHTEFLRRGLDVSVKLPLPANIHKNRVRANQWSYCDFDGDGALDVIVGVGDWTDYGWDDAFNSEGRWTRGPLRGHVYLVRNEGVTGEPRYAAPRLLEAAGKPIDVFGRPTPNFADFDADGDLDLLCGEFLDQFSYFENVGSRTEPRYAAPRRLRHNGEPLAMDLQMIVPVAVDWDKDGDTDLIVGDEDGRVALVEHTGKVVDGTPVFLPPRYFRQQADNVMCGALATPCGFDWDGDGDDDILSGNTAGYIVFYENLGPGASGSGTSGSEHPKWAAPRPLEAGGKVLRIQAGVNGSIQGPCEAKWGYTTLTVGDWDHDGLPDILANSIWGKVLWYRNAGSRSEPRLEAARSVRVAWPGVPPKPEWTWWDAEAGTLATQWRTTPVVVDWNADGLNDLVMLDHEGYLAFFEREKSEGALRLQPGKRVFLDESGDLLRPNEGRAGRSGRRKLAIVDWDGDGRLDLLMNSQNADWYRQLEPRGGKHVFKNMGALDARKLAGHTSSPTVVDWNRDGVPDLLVGAEDGFFYYVRNPRR